MTSGISAEYGRFAGGVVNSLTKSGGNQFTGSLRLNLQNDSWTQPTPVTEERDDTINRIWEATAGGFLLQDKVWFFLAARDSSLDQINQTGITNIPYPVNDEQTRLEGKLTFSLTNSHRFVGSYISIDRTRTNSAYGVPLELEALSDREDPQALLALNYNGVITPELFVQAQYSKRDYTIAKGAGSPHRGDLLLGTPLNDYLNGWTWNTPWFCSVCGDEERNNEDYLVKGSWFLSSESLGSHDLVFGWDEYHDKMFQDNIQSASDWILWVPDTIVDGDEIYPVVVPYGTYMMWWPLLESTRGTDFQVTSLFVNDMWRLNDRWSFSLGARFDRNDGVNSAGNQIAKDDRISPRLGVSYDVFGNGTWLVNASYGHYVGALAGSNNVANGSSSAGSPALFGYLYAGPAINTDGPVMATDEALAAMFDWFYNEYGGPTNGALQWIQRVPGITRGIAGGSIGSPYAEEYSLGVTRRLGNRGLMRLDYQHRNYKDLYETRVDTGTGTIQYEVLAGMSGIADYQLIQNSDYLTREYDGVSLQLEYRPGEDLVIGGSYTWSHAKGNFDGETAGNGPITSTNNPNFYPEYADVSWSNPEGDLGVDQRHKLRSWVVWNAISGRRHNLSASALFNFWSGTPYSAVGAVDTTFVDNPGYINPPPNVPYFFSERGAYTTPNIYRSDLSLNYGFFFNVGATELEIFVQPEVLNVFNHDRAVNVNASVFDATSSVSYEPFDPFTETPVEGVHWAKGSSFGEPQVETDYQQPRTFRLSLGVRF
jgi:hypothetical protein